MTNDEDQKNTAKKNRTNKQKLINNVIKLINNKFTIKIVNITNLKRLIENNITRGIFRQKNLKLYSDDGYIGP